MIGRGMDDDLVNNMLCNGNAVGEGGIPAVALGAALPVGSAAAPLPDALVLRVFADAELKVEIEVDGAKGAEEDAESAALSVVEVDVGTAGPCEDAKALEEENWMPP